MDRLTELHRHIDCSIRASTLAELARQSGLKEIKSEKEVREHFWLTRPMNSLNEVLERLVIFQKVLSSVAILEQVACEVVEDAHQEGIGELELRYSPNFASGLSKIPWEDVLNAFVRGLTRGSAKTGVKTGLICILGRGGPPSLADEVIDFAVAHKKNFIAVDLAGPEENFPCRLYKEAFRRAVDEGFPVTIHAGEACGPENIWEAIDLLGATRIGHGVHAVEDKELMKRLAQDRILLETCPTSNTITQAVSKWEEHPLPQFLEAGIPVSISTDDPGIFGITLQEEFERCKKYLGLTDSDIHQINQTAHRHTFLK